MLSAPIHVKAETYPYKLNWFACLSWAAGGHASLASVFPAHTNGPITECNAH